MLGQSLVLLLFCILTGFLWNAQGVSDRDSGLTDVGVPCADGSDDFLCPKCTDYINEDILETVCKYHSVVHAVVTDPHSSGYCGKMNTTADVFNNHEMTDFAYFTISSKCTCMLLKDKNKIFIVGPPTSWQNDIMTMKVTIDQEFIVFPDNSRNNATVLDIIQKCVERSTNNLEINQRTKRKSASESLAQYDYSESNEQEEEESEGNAPFQQAQDKLPFAEKLAEFSNQEQIQTFNQISEPLPSMQQIQTSSQKAEPLPSFQQIQTSNQMAENLPPLQQTQVPLQAQFPVHQVQSNIQNVYDKPQYSSVYTQQSPASTPYYAQPRLVYRSPVIYLERKYETLTLPPTPVVYYDQTSGNFPQVTTRYSSPSYKTPVPVYQAPTPVYNIQPVPFCGTISHAFLPTNHAHQETSAFYPTPASYQQHSNSQTPTQFPVNQKPEIRSYQMTPVYQAQTPSPALQKPTPLYQAQSPLPILQKPTPLYQAPSPLPILQKPTPLYQAMSPLPILQKPATLYQAQSPLPVLQKPVPLYQIQSPSLMIKNPTPVYQVPRSLYQAPLVSPYKPTAPIGQKKVPLTVYKAPAPPAPVLQAPAPLPVLQAPVPLPMLQAPAPLPVLQIPAPLPMLQVPASPVYQSSAPSPSVYQIPTSSSVYQAPTPLPVYQPANLLPVFQASAPSVYKTQSVYQIPSSFPAFKYQKQTPLVFQTRTYQKPSQPIYREAVPRAAIYQIPSSISSQAAVPLPPLYQKPQLPTPSVPSALDLQQQLSNSPQVYNSPIPVQLQQQQSIPRQVPVPISYSLIPQVQSKIPVDNIYRSSPIIKPPIYFTPVYSKPLVPVIPTFQGQQKVDLPVVQQLQAQREILIDVPQPIENLQTSQMAQTVYQAPQELYQSAPAVIKQKTFPEPVFVTQQQVQSFISNPSENVEPVQQQQNLPSDNSEMHLQQSIPMRGVRESRLPVEFLSDQPDETVDVLRENKSIQITGKATKEEAERELMSSGNVQNNLKVDEDPYKNSIQENQNESKELLRAKRDDTKQKEERNYSQTDSAKDEKTEQASENLNPAPQQMLADETVRYDSVMYTDSGRTPVPTTELDNPLYEQALIAPPLPSLKYSHSYSNMYDSYVDVSVCSNSYDCPHCVEEIEGSLLETVCDYQYILVVDLQPYSQIFPGGDYGVSCNVMEIATFVSGDFNLIASGTLAFQRNDICQCSFANQFVGPFIIMASQDSFYPHGGPFTSFTMDRTVKLVRYSFRNRLAVLFALDKCGKLPPLPSSNSYVYVRKTKQEPATPSPPDVGYNPPVYQPIAPPVYQPSTPPVNQPSAPPSSQLKGQCPSGTSPSCPKCMRDIYDPSFQSMYCSAAAAYVINQGMVPVPPDSIAEKSSYPVQGQSYRASSRQCKVYNFNYLTNLKSYSQEQTPTEVTEAYMETYCSCTALNYPGSVLLMSLHGGKASYGRKLHLNKDHVIISLAPGPVRLPPCQITQSIPPQTSYSPVPAPSFPCPSYLQNSCPYCGSSVNEETLQIFCEAPYVVVAQSLSYGVSSECQAGSVLLRQEVTRSQGVQGVTVQLGTELQYFLKPDCTCPALNTGTGYVLLISTRVLNQRSTQLTSDHVVISLNYGRTALPACVSSTAQETVYSYKQKPDYQTTQASSTIQKPPTPRYAPIRSYPSTSTNYTIPNVYSSQPRPAYSSSVNATQRHYIPQIKPGMPNPVTIQLPRPAPSNIPVPSYQPAPVQKPASAQIPRPALAYPKPSVVNIPRPGSLYRPNPQYPAPPPIHSPRYQPSVPQYPLTRDGRSLYGGIFNTTHYIPPQYLYGSSHIPPMAVTNCPSTPDTCSQTLTSIDETLKQEICTFSNVLLLEMQSIGRMRYNCGLARVVKAIRGHPSLFADTVRFAYKNTCIYPHLREGARVYVLNRISTTYGKRLKSLILDSEAILLSYNRVTEQELMSVLSTCGEDPKPGLDTCPLVDGGCPECFMQPPENYRETFCRSQHAIVVAIGLDYEAMRTSNSTDLIFKKQHEVENIITVDPDSDTFATISVKQSFEIDSSGTSGQCFREKLRILFDASPQSRLSAYNKDITSYVPAECNCNLFHSGPGYGVIMSTGRPVLVSTSDRIQLSDGYTTFPLPLGTVTFPSCSNSSRIPPTFFRFPKERSVRWSPSAPQLQPLQSLQDANSAAQYKDCGYRTRLSCPRCYPYFTQGTLDDFCAAEYAYVVTAEVGAPSEYRYKPQLSVISSLDYTKLNVQGSNMIPASFVPGSHERSKRGAEHFCPVGFVYSSCAPPMGCEPTCQSPHSVQCYSRYCQPGCTCPEGKVRQGATCVSYQECVDQKYLDKCLFGRVHVVETIKVPVRGYPVTDPLPYFIRGYCSCPFLEHPQGSALIFSRHPIYSDSQLDQDVQVVVLPYGTTSIPKCGGHYYIRPSAPKKPVITHTVVTTPPPHHNPIPNREETNTPEHSEHTYTEEKSRHPKERTTSTTEEFDFKHFENLSKTTPSNQLTSDNLESVSTTESPESPTKVPCPKFEGCPDCTSYSPETLEKYFCSYKQAIIVAVGTAESTEGIQFKAHAQAHPRYTFPDDKVNGSSYRSSVDVYVRSETSESYLQTEENTACYVDHGKVLYDVTGASDPKTENRTIVFQMPSECLCSTLFGAAGYVLIIAKESIPQEDNLPLGEKYIVMALPYGISLMPYCKTSAWIWDNPNEVVLPSTGPREVFSKTSICPGIVQESCPRCYANPLSNLQDMDCKDFNYSLLMITNEDAENKYLHAQISVAKITLDTIHRHRFVISSEEAARRNYTAVLPSLHGGTCPSENVKVGSYCFPESPFKDGNRCVQGYAEALHLKAKEGKRKKRPDVNFSYIIREECLCPSLDAPHEHALLLTKNIPKSERNTPYQFTEDDIIVSLPYGLTNLPHCEPTDTDSDRPSSDSPILLPSNLPTQCPELPRTCPKFENFEIEADSANMICGSDYGVEVEVVQSPSSQDNPTNCSVGQVVNVIKGRRADFQEEIMISYLGDKCSRPILRTGFKVFVFGSGSSWMKLEGEEAFTGLSLDQSTIVLDSDLDDELKNALDNCSQS